MIFDVPTGRFLLATVLAAAGLWSILCGVNACWLRWGRRVRPREGVPPKAP